jgi:hypothetical protein
MVSTPHAVLKGLFVILSSLHSFWKLLLVVKEQSISLAEIKNREYFRNPPKAHAMEKKNLIMMHISYLP